MIVLRPFFTFTLIIMNLSAFSQSADSSFFLRWKLQPGMVLSYKTEMKIIKDTSSDMSKYFDRVFKNFDLAKRDTVDKQRDVNSFMTQMRRQMDESPSYITTLTRKGPVINVEIDIEGNDSSRIKFDTSALKRNFFRSAMFMLSGGVMLRGTINEDGSLNSFYVNNEQRNLLGLFFDLPGKPVKVGDSWSLDVHLISETQNFICDSSSRKNSVKVTGIEYKNGQHIVTVKYDIREYASGFSKTPFAGNPLKETHIDSYQGIARFSIEKGFWIYYDCQLSTDVSGEIMAQKITKYTLSR